MATLKLNADQLPQWQNETGAAWNCDEYCIHFDAKTKVLTVEEFFGFDDDGNEDTQVITDSETVSDILCRFNPYLMGDNPMALVVALELPGIRGQWSIAKEPR
jgi:hypothetical protein